MTDLPVQFTERMKERLGEDFSAFSASYARPPLRGLRVNPLKISAEDFLLRAPFPLGERVPWEKNAYYQDADRPGGDVYHFAGLYYLQEPSAMCAAPLLKAGRGEKVLDRLRPREDPRAEYGAARHHELHGDFAPAPPPCRETARIFR